jgi:YHS domain-containing protein
MYNRTLLCSLLFAAGCLLGTSSFAAADGPKPADPAKAAPATKPGKLIPLSEKDAEWAANARKSYPLKTCLTSDEELGSMGDSAEYIYRVDGKADQLVVFCCDGCNEDFLKDPATFLAKLDAAKDAKSKAAHKAHH